MILVTKHNVTTELLESICSNDGTLFLLQTPNGIEQFKLMTTINSLGAYRHKTGMLVSRGQGPYLVFNSRLDVCLHGDVTELVSDIQE